MSIGVFIDRNNRPSDTEVFEAIGPRLTTWQELGRIIRDNYPVREEFKFLYGDKYGWGLEFRLKGRLLVSLYPNRDGFTAQVILPPEAVEKIQRMNLGKNVRKAIARAKPYPEGRWLFVPIETEKDFKNIQQLIALRAEKKNPSSKRPH